MATADGEILDTAADVTTALARHTRTLDDRLTLLGMRMFYIAMSFFFACFFFAQTYLQIVNMNNMWLPKSVHRPLGGGTLFTALILLSGLVYFWGQWAGLYRRNFGRLNLALWVAGLLGLIAVIVNIIVLRNPGFGLQDGGYASVFAGFYGVYTVFVFISAVILLGLANRARAGLLQTSGIAVETFGEWWGWMSAVALFGYLALFVVPFFPIE